MNAPLPYASATLQPSQRSLAVKTSVVRELLKAALQPGAISLAGGLPAPELFPVEPLRAAFDRVLTTAGTSALQYSETEGYGPLREWIAAQETARGVPTRLDEVLIVSGSQQALDLIGKALIDPGTPWLVESPTYLGALQAFSVYEPQFRAVASDDEGLMPAVIDGALARGARAMYVMPTFQNPSGRTLSAARRAALAAAARTHDFWLIEDDPYGELWYDRAPPASLRSHAPERTIRVCSLSKVLAPGLRLGYVVAPAPVIDLLARLKQAADLHTATLNQRVAHDVLASGLMHDHLPKLRARYAERAQAMLAALARLMPPQVSWTRPSGGMFIWLTLPVSIDAMALLPRAIERGLVFVPGAPFYANAPQANTLRLSFVTVTPDRIEHGVQILSTLIREAMQDTAR